MSSVRKFISHFSQFFVGSSLSVLVGLVSFPILTRILSQEEYGILGLMSTTMLIAVAASKAGLSNAILRFYSEYSSTSEPRTIFSSTILLRGLLLSGITVVLYFLGLPLLFNASKIDPRFLSCFKIMSVYVFIRPMNIIVLNVLNARGNTLFLNSVNLAERILSVGLSLCLFLFLFRSLDGYFIGEAAAEVLIGVSLFYWFFSQFKIDLKKVSKSLTIKLAKFGAPLLFSELLYLLLSYFDRYMILWYLGLASVGVYSVGYNLAVYVSNSITLSLSYAIVPIYVDIYEKNGREETQRFLGKSLDYLVTAIIPVCVGFYAVCGDLMVLLASSKYEGAAGFSPVVLVGTLVLGMNRIYNAGLYLNGKTMIILYIMCGALCTNILANLFFIPRWGIAGAAYTTLIACVVSAVATIVFSFRFISVKLSWGNAVYQSAISCIMFTVLKEIRVEDAWYRLFTKFGVGVLIVVLGVLAKERFFAGRSKKVRV
jgi:O-antigen/teichoic acid export membrane protein